MKQRTLTPLSPNDLFAQDEKQTDFIFSQKSFFSREAFEFVYFPEPATKNWQLLEILVV